MQGKYQRWVNKGMLSLGARSGSHFPLTNRSLKKPVAAEHLSCQLAGSLTGDPFTRRAAGCFLIPKGVTQPCFQDALLCREHRAETCYPSFCFSSMVKASGPSLLKLVLLQKAELYMCVYMQAYKAYSVTTLCCMQTFVVLFCVCVGQLAKFVIAI